MSRARRQDGCRRTRSEQGGNPIAQVMGEFHHRGERLADDPHIDPVAGAALLAASSIEATSPASVSSSAARESSQPRTSEAMALTPLGSTATLPKVASAPASRAFFLAASTVMA